MDDREFESKHKLGAGLDGRHSLPAALILAADSTHRQALHGVGKRKSSECFTAQEFDDRLAGAVDQLLNGGPGDSARVQRETEIDAVIERCRADSSDLTDVA